MSFPPRPQDGAFLFLSRLCHCEGRSDEAISFHCHYRERSSNRTCAVASGIQNTSNPSSWAQRRILRRFTHVIPECFSRGSSHAWTADTDIFFLLKSDAHAGVVVSQSLGHANRLAECNVVRFLTQKKISASACEWLALGVVSLRGAKRRSNLFRMPIY